VRFLAGYRRPGLVDEAPLEHAFARVVMGASPFAKRMRPTVVAIKVSGGHLTLVIPGAV
jgi:hypothetical protein